MATRKKIYGEWGYGTLPTDLSTYTPYYNGWHLITTWKALEPSAGVYDFSALETDMLRLKNAGLNIGLTMWVNPKRNLPAWLFVPPFSVPVPTVTTQITVTSYGYYLDAMDSYKTRLFLMIDALLDYLATSPAQPNVIYYQSAEGHEDLTQAYIGVPDQVRFKITKADWLTFQKSVWLHTYNQMETTIDVGEETGIISQYLDLIINAADSDTIRDYVIATLPSASLRKSGEGQDYGANLEDFDYIAIDEENAIQEANPGVMRKRTDFDFIAQQAWFNQAFRQNIMQVALTMIDKGNDYWTINDIADLKDLATHRTVSDLVTRLSGNQSPIGLNKIAWWAANSKIDASDIDRFPTVTYGHVLTNGADTSSNPDDYVKIANMNRLNKILKIYNPTLITNSITACTLITDQFGNHAQTDKRLEDHWKADIGMKVRTKPVGAWMTEASFSVQSKYYWRLGNPQTDYWGRYAVGFLSTTSPNNKKYWKLDAAFKTGLTSVSVTLVYWNDGNTQWRFRNVAGTDALLKTNTNTKEWKTVVFSIPAFVSGTLLNGNDFAIEYIAGSNTVAFAYMDVVKKASTVNVLPVVNAGSDQQITGTSATLTGTATDADGIASTLWDWADYDADGNPIYPDGATPVITTPTALTTTVTAMTVNGDYNLSLKATDIKNGVSTDRVIITKTGAITTPTADAGPDKTITLPLNTTTVGGTDTAPPGFAIASRAWTVVSVPDGAANPTFGTGTAASTTVIGLNVAGSYVVRKTVTDTQVIAQTDTDDVTITVLPNTTNIPPVVNAGANQQVTIATATLTATATDDGTIISKNWAFISGPATASVTSPGQLSTGITGMTVNGDYIFRFKATDNDNATSMDEVTITRVTTIVNPTANAGPDKPITEPTSQVTIGGTDTAPAGFSIASRTWTKQNGLDGPVIVSPGTASTQITGLVLPNGSQSAEWTYRKTIYDNQTPPHTSFDDAKITLTSDSAIVTKWGMACFSALSTQTRINLSTNLTVDIIRVECGLSSFTNALNESYMHDVAQANKKANMVVTWDNSGGIAHDFVHGADLNVMLSNLEQMLVYYGPTGTDTIEFVTFENEPDNPNNYNADSDGHPNTAWYITEGAAIIALCNQYNVPVSDGCIHVQNAGATSGRVKTIKDAYAVEWAGLDYINIHGYYPRDSASQWKTAVDAINAKKAAGQKIVSNECGIKDKNNVSEIIQSQAAELAGIIMSHQFAYGMVVAVPGAGPAKPFNVGSTATLNCNGECFVTTINGGGECATCP